MSRKTSRGRWAAMKESAAGGSVKRAVTTTSGWLLSRYSISSQMGGSSSTMTVV
jgi:hypothetical protein